MSANTKWLYHYSLKRDKGIFEENKYPVKETEKQYKIYERFIIPGLYNTVFQKSQFPIIADRYSYDYMVLSDKKLELEEIKQCLKQPLMDEYNKLMTAMGRIKKDLETIDNGAASVLHCIEEDAEEEKEL